jgi:hypothetical protein
MKKYITEITTTDTKKTYNYERFSENDNPQIWEATISVNPVDGNSGEKNNYPTKSKTIYLERATLENASLLPMEREREIEKVQPTETAEDLIIRLLNHVGFYPTE